MLSNENRKQISKHLSVSSFAEKHIQDEALTQEAEQAVKTESLKKKKRDKSDDEEEDGQKPDSQSAKRKNQLDTSEWSSPSLQNMQHK